MGFKFALIDLHILQETSYEVQMSN